MPSGYQILNNRPLDQWKVTELKEELKRRKLKTVGLKEDLVKRLDEAVRTEREAAEINTVVVSDSDPQPQAVVSFGEGVPINAETVVGTDDVTKTSGQENSETFETTKKKDAGTSNRVGIEMDEKENDGSKNDCRGGGDNHEMVDIVKVHVDINLSESNVELEKSEQDGLQGTGNSSMVGEVSAVIGTSAAAENNIVASETDVSEPLVTQQGSQDINTEDRSEIGETNLENENTKVSQTTVDSVAQLKNEGLETQLENENTKVSQTPVDSVPQLKNEGSEAQLESEDSMAPPIGDGSMLQMEFDSKRSDEELLPDPSAPECQVSEVKPILGSQVKSDSVSTDSLSINEKIELKDNIITDNVTLEKDNLKVAMVEPSTSNVVPVADESCSMNVEETHEKKASLGEKNDNSAASPDLNKTNVIEDMVYPEKLNLDRSSGEDSMDEDLPENKQLDAKYSLDEPKEKSGIGEVPITREKCSVVTSPEALYVKKDDAHVDNDSYPSAAAEKRKLPDQATVGNNEPSKRQRRWNADRVNVPNSQTANFTSDSSSTINTPKDIPTLGTRSVARSDSSVNEEAPKERIVPPSQKALTNSLKIDRFLRPFTLKAVHELLGKTGTVTDFWMDHIKTHCYVTFSSVEEAIETRNAVYNLQWPPNGGRLLVADFVDPQEVKMKVEAPAQAAPVNAGASVAPAPTASKPEPSPRQPKQHHQPQLPPAPPLPNQPPSAKEQPPSRQPVPEKAEPVTLDDLFRKTQAAPRIYYLPLNEDQIAAKLAAQSKITNTRRQDVN